MAETTRWIIKVNDLYGEIHGPYSSVQMHEWYMRGEFQRRHHTDLWIARGEYRRLSTHDYGRIEYGEYELLYQLERRKGNARSPFDIWMQPESSSSTSALATSSSTQPPRSSTTPIGSCPCEVSNPIDNAQPPSAMESPTSGRTLCVEQSDASERCRQKEINFLATQEEPPSTPSEALEARLDAHANAPVAASFIPEDGEQRFDLKSVSSQNATSEDFGGLGQLSLWPKTRQGTKASMLSQESDNEPPPITNHATKPVGIARLDEPLAVREKQYKNVDRPISQHQNQLSQGLMNIVDEEKALSVVAQLNRHQKDLEAQPRPQKPDEPENTVEPLRKGTILSILSATDWENMRTIADLSELRDGFRMADQQLVAKSDHGKDAEAPGVQVKFSNSENDQVSDSTECRAHSTEHQKETGKDTRVAGQVESHPEVSLNFGPEVPFTASEAGLMKEATSLGRSATSYHVPQDMAEHFRSASKYPAAPKAQNTSGTYLRGLPLHEQKHLPPVTTTVLSAPATPPFTLAMDACLEGHEKEHIERFRRDYLRPAGSNFGLGKNLNGLCPEDTLKLRVAASQENTLSRDFASKLGRKRSAVDKTVGETSEDSFDAADVDAPERPTHAHVLDDASLASGSSGSVFEKVIKRGNAEIRWIRRNQGVGGDDDSSSSESDEDDLPIERLNTSRPFCGKSQTMSLPTQVFKQSNCCEQGVELNCSANRSRQLENIATSAVHGARRTPDQQLIGETLYKHVHKLQPQLAGKITGMLMEMKTTQIIKLTQDPVFLCRKVTEAYSVYEEYVKSDRSTKENLRQTLFPMIGEVLGSEVELAGRVTDVVLGMDHAEIFELIVDGDALRRKVDWVIGDCGGEVGGFGNDPLEGMGEVEVEGEIEDAAEDYGSDEGDESFMDDSESFIEENCCDEEDCCCEEYYHYEEGCYDEEDCCDKESYCDEENYCDEEEEDCCDGENCCHEGDCDKESYYDEDQGNCCDEENYFDEEEEDCCDGENCCHEGDCGEDYYDEEGEECEEDCEQDCYNEEDCYNEGDYYDEEGEECEEDCEEDCYDEEDCDEGYYDKEDCSGEINTQKEEQKQHNQQDHHIAVCQSLSHEFPDPTAKVMERMDQEPFPKSILAADCIDIEVPDWINTWWELRNYAATNAECVQQKRWQLLDLQVECWKKQQQRIVDNRKVSLPCQSPSANAGSSTGLGCSRIPIYRGKDGMGPVGKFNARDFSSGNGAGYGESLSSATMMYTGLQDLRTIPRIRHQRHRSYSTGAQVVTTPDRSDDQLQPVSAQMLQDLPLIPQQSTTRIDDQMQTLPVEEFAIRAAFIKNTIEARRREQGHNPNLAFCPLTEEEEEFLKPLLRQFNECRLKFHVENKSVIQAASTPVTQPLPPPPTEPRPFKNDFVRDNFQRKLTAGNRNEAMTQVTTPPATPATLFALSSSSDRSSDIGKEYNFPSGLFSLQDTPVLARGEVNGEDEQLSNRLTRLDSSPFPAGPSLAYTRLEVDGPQSTSFASSPLHAIIDHPTTTAATEESTDLSFSWIDESEELDVSVRDPDFDLDLGTKQNQEQDQNQNQNQEQNQEQDQEQEQASDPKTEPGHERTPSVNLDFKFPDPKIKCTREPLLAELDLAVNPLVQDGRGVVQHASDTGCTDEEWEVIGGLREDERDGVGKGWFGWMGAWWD